MNLGIRLSHGATLVASLLTLLSVQSSSGQTNVPIPPGTNLSTVRVVASDPSASEAGPDTGTFTLRREGGDTNLAMNIFFHLGGTAQNGVDYVTGSSNAFSYVYLPPGALSADVTITPIDDSIAEPTETVILQIIPPPYLNPFLYYRIGWPSNAVVEIADNDTVTDTNIPPTVRIYVVEPSSGAVFQAPANIAIFAQPNDVDGTVETVEFFEGTNSLGVVTNGPMVMSPINPWHIFWTNVPAGAYALRAKATDDKGAIGWSEAVRVYVVESTNRPTVVNVVATDPDAEEIPVVPPGMGMPQRDNPAVFTIFRSGETNDPLTVYFHLSGTALNGIDYVKVGDSATIAPGALSTDLIIDPIDDILVEGTETVVLTLDPPVCIAIFPPPPGCYELGAFRSAVAYIRDNDTISNLAPKVVITDPTNGETFAFPNTIRFEAAVTDPDGYAWHVDFFANGRKVAEETINFFVAPPPGQTMTFSIDWVVAEPGLYELVARATDDRGAVGVSAPVHISVTGTNFPPPTNLPVVTITATDPVATEGTNCWRTTPDPASGLIVPLCGRNTATFVVRRSGPTNSDLTVVYGIGGSASNGVDYLTLPGFVTIPAGARHARIIVDPIDDKDVEGAETVVLSLQIPPSPLSPINAPPPYVIGFPGKAAAVILDNDSPRPPTRCLSDGLFHACFPGTNGFCYRIEISADILNWLPICTNSVTDGAIHFVDPDTLDFPHRFYRAVPEPCVGE